MNPKNLFDSYWFIRIVLLLWLVSSALTVFSLRGIDNIVHVKLYNYGLQFSNDWAQPYWAFADMIYISLAIPMFLSGIVLVFSLLTKNDDKKTSQTKERVEQSVPARVETNGRGIVISCSSCKRVVSKPLVMLDFSGGKAKLVNLCPYCNAILGTVEKEDAGVTVDLTEEVVH